MDECYVFKDLEPNAVFKCFYDISMIPRVPGKQEQISGYIADYARSLGLAAYQDRKLNVIVYKPAAKGYENAEPLILQAHMDMICEKEPDKEHDFGRDPLTLIRNGDKITADRTTLGADNGIGVAYMMALMADKHAMHPALEFIFTTDEETDMGGAFGLEFDKLKSKTIINLDAPAVCVCGSGELEVEIDIPKQTQRIEDGYVHYNIKIDGLTGGHTGYNAMLEKGNAVTYLNRILIEIEKKVNFQLLYIQGGAGMSSAFARNSECDIAFPPDDLDLVTQIVNECFILFKKELEKRDKEVNVAFAPSSRSTTGSFSAKTKSILMNLLCILPDGIFALNKDFDGAMEACSNVGVAETYGDKIFVTILIRSTTAGKKYYLYEKVVRICDLLGVNHKIGRDLPHWDYAVDENLKAILQKVYPNEEHGIVQGTLETGIFCANIPDACVITLGCPYYNAHSPSEYFLISEAKTYWEKLLEFLSLMK